MHEHEGIKLTYLKKKEEETGYVITLSILCLENRPHNLYIRKRKKKENE